MEESKEQIKMYGLFQAVIYFTIVFEVLLFVFENNHPFDANFNSLITRFFALPIYKNVYYSKVFTLVLIFVVSIGTKPRKQLDFDIYKMVLIPLTFGSIIFFGSGIFTFKQSSLILYTAGDRCVLDFYDLLYFLGSLLGGILIHISIDNISKLVKSNFLKDRFNVENESFDQSRKLIENEYSINIPMKFYFKKRINKGWINILNPFRGTILIGTPGSGKTFSIIVPYIKQLMAKGFSAFVYDFKYPDLAKMTYYHYLLNKKKGVLKNHKFHVINLNDVEYSRRINPLNPKYVKSLADATETADALLQALRKIDSNSGTDQFFTQSAVNMLSSVIYFFSRYESGKYSTFPHILAFLNRTYDEIFDLLYLEPELESLLSPFKSAYDKKAYDQLEGQLGTLKINISRLSTKETFWVFSGDDFNLKISDPESPSVLVIANDPETQEINSACYSLVINRLTKLINKKGNFPSFLAIDEIPTLYVHKIDNLIATARSNRVAILMGLQELPQFYKQYGKQTADTICSVVANIISGQAKKRETLDWLEKLFGRVRQVKQGLSIDRSKTSISLNEQLDSLIPASKISSLQQGQLVAQIAQDNKKLTGKYIQSNYYCMTSFDTNSIIEEEKQYIETPKFYDFGSLSQRDDILTNNMRVIKSDIQKILEKELVNG